MPFDDEIDEAERHVDNAGDGARQVGQGKQDADQAGEDLQDGDQDTADKAGNAGHGGADALRHGEQALKDWGILDDDDSSIGDIADGIDQLTEELFGKKRAPDSLPPLRYRVFFGKKSDLTSGLMDLGQSALDDALGIGDSLLEAGAEALGVGDYLGTDPFSSVMEKHSPFAEDPAELDAEESIWKLVHVRCEEGLNQLTRCEVLLATDEYRNPALEAALGAKSAAGGLLDQIAGPIKSAISIVESVRDIADPAASRDGADDVLDEDISDAEADVAAKEADLAGAEHRLAELEAEKKALTDAGLGETSVDEQLAAARREVRLARAALQRAEHRLASLRARSRASSSTVTDVARRVAGIKDGADRLSKAESFADALGAVSDILFGEERAGYPDGPVFVNVPLDPADFLGQTCSLRVSREFRVASRDPAASNDVPGYSFSARYVTGVVVEMEDLGERAFDGSNLAQPSPAPPAGRRFLRLVLMPELAKLALRRDHRVFNDMSALSIVREVLRSAGVYGFLPNIPGVGVATDALSNLASNIPFVGNAVADAVSGQFIKLIPPPSTNASPSDASARMPAEHWTQKREMCVQYGETDLDFVRRLLEEEGIHFTFTCRRGFERLVLLHDPMELDQAPTVDGRPVPFEWPHWLSSPKVETLERAAERRRMRPAKFTLRDFSFSDAQQRPTTQAEPKAGSPGALLGVTAEASRAYGERYEYPGRYPLQYLDGDEAIHYREFGSGEHDRNLALLRLEEEASRARRVTLHTNLIGASGDTTLRLRGFTFDRDGLAPPATGGPPPADRVVVERVRWTGSSPALANVVTGPNYQLPAGSLPDYENEITGWWINDALRATTPVRPERKTPKPHITSLTTATVVDWTGDHDEDEEIEHEHPTSTRVRVRFHWDRRGELPLGIVPPIGHIAPRGTTCWCRVAQVWAGADFGVLFVPRVGTEVVVAFENGDPDRPVVVGSLYDGEHPVPLPGEEAPREGFERPKADPVQLSTIMTRTSPWDEDEGVVSELTFDDTMGKERVLLKAGRHLVEEVEGTHESEVARNQSNEVGRHHGEIVEKRQRLLVRGDREKTVYRRQTEVIRGAREVRVLERQKILVTLDHAESVQGVVRLVGKGDRELIVHGERSTVVGDPADAQPAHDLHDVSGAKTDAIAGTLRVRAKDLAIVQPGMGEDAPEAALTSGQGDGEEPAMTARSDTGFRLAADGEVRIVSNEAEVELECARSFAATVSVPMVEIGAPASGGVGVWHDQRVEVHTENGVLVTQQGSLRLRAMGEAEALVALTESGARIEGRTGVVNARKEIRDTSAAQAHGE